MFQLTPQQRHWLEFLLAMTEKEIKARYKFAVLGFFWIVLNPVLQMTVVGFIFQYFIPVKMENYFLFLFSGLLVWNFFSYTITKNTPMILNERGLIHKANFPKEVIILSIVLANMFHTLIAFALLLLISIGMFSFDIQNIFYFMLGIILIFLLTSGFSLLLSALNVRFRDVNFAVQALMPLLFYATPIIYTRDLLPPVVAKALLFNPLTAVVELFQYIFTKTVPINSLEIIFSLTFSIVIFFLGLKYFVKESLFFDDWV